MTPHSLRAACVLAESFRQAMRAMLAGTETEIACRCVRSPEAATVRRTSMELTKALAEIRRRKSSGRSARVGKTERRDMQAKISSSLTDSVKLAMAGNGIDDIGGDYNPAPTSDKIDNPSCGNSSFLHQ